MSYTIKYSFFDTGPLVPVMTIEYVYEAELVGSSNRAIITARQRVVVPEPYQAERGRDYEQLGAFSAHEPLFWFTGGPNNLHKEGWRLASVPR